MTSGGVTRAEADDIPAPPWKRAAKAAKPVRRQLSRDAIVDAALRVLDKEGLDAVTMRRVGQELHTGAASLYVHVENKEELHHLLLDRVIADIPLAEPDPTRPLEQVKEFVRNSVRVMAAHPGVAQIAMSGLPSGANALRMMEYLLTLLRLAGLPDQVVAWAGDLLGDFIPAIALEQSFFRQAGITEQSMAERVGQYRDYLLSLPADRFPTLRSLAANMVTGSGNERFEFKLDVMLSGLLAVAAR
ncbi:AcrR family transcriptional regulator [Hamadaea flava]|uniref:TetR/AcrR family transcriptional regulator n=1 Tax=Hamadaea flava TaxID=1742688 RepID=A0ABV8LJQ3_9ACTN|nr:TetR/AcrR family transcriptional regulator [Hamadaea flava]MCP2325324.1 AcrR family transcriptional regulator [Hamadaea flava]